MKIPDWNSYFMTMAYLVASKSKDRRTHIGAVVVGSKNEVRSIGYNGFVRGLNDDVPERYTLPEKYFWVEHAERNAIYNATLIGVSLEGCKMYTNGVPCMDCARAIVQSGIERVIVDEEWSKNNSKKWEEHAKRSLKMFEEIGVKIIYWKGKLIETHKFRNGHKILKNTNL